MKTASLTNEKLWAYLAGLIDADGSISFGRPSRQTSSGVRYEPRVRIAGRFDHLARLKALVGSGSISTSHQANRRSELQWSCAAARNILRHVIPYLRLKHAQAKIVLATPFGPKNRFRRPTVQREQNLAFERMRELNASNGRGRFSWQ